MAAPPVQKEDTNLLKSGGNPNNVPEKLDDSNPAAPSQSPGKYPYGVFFIVGNEFCERFSYYGMRAILVLYFTDWLGYSNNSATAIFHAFVAVCYFSPLFGAIIADGFWGKYKTILSISLIYCVGNILMSFTAFPPPHPAGPFIALTLIGLATGGIKPCVCAFGGDQFSSQQERWLDQFFSVFYFAINLGSLLSMVITPLIRQNVHCFGTNCFPLAFGIPAILMILSLVMFVAGRNVYKKYPPAGNVIGNMIMAIGRAIKNRCSSGGESRDHWLDYADDKYDTDFLCDVRSVLRVFLMFLPLPLFWALFDQQGSRWILQARQMDLTLGSWQIPPDLIPVLNPALLIILIPLMESCCYPILDKCHILTKPLQRMVFGMTLGAIAFIIAGCLQVRIDNAESARFAVEENEVTIGYINAGPCPIQIHAPWGNDSLHVEHCTEPHVTQEGTYKLHFHAVNPFGPCSELAAQDSITLNVSVKAGKAYYVALYEEQNKLMAKQFRYPTRNPEPSMALVGMMYLSEVPLPTDMPQVHIYSHGDITHNYSFFTSQYEQSEYKDIAPETYGLYVRTTTEDSFVEARVGNDLSVVNGAIYTVVVQSSILDAKTLDFVSYEDFPGNNITVLWQFPQYILITVGEIFFSISGLSFSYSQAPASMKSVVQAGWLITVAVGNVIDVVVAGASLLPSQSAEFFFFAGMMAVVTIVFAIMSYFYQYSKHERPYELHYDDDGGIIHGDELAESHRSSSAENIAESPYKYT